jgi:demethylmenaquinone methyltransferase/2-methoxy-6-polyprenyl-1,4-benzoquinol methylase
MTNYENKITKSQNPESEWFGFKQVNSDEKQDMVDDVFHSVAQRYDIMNDAMSFGMHRLWKNRLIREIRPKTDEKFLDVAGGTGDIAFRIYERTNKHADITVYDINQSMLDVGQDRALDKGYGDESMQWVCGNAETLPFDDNSFDVYTIVFGLRNVAHIDNALSEAKRVLKTGGRLFCMEFSHVDNPLVRKFYDIYSEKLIPTMGQAIANDRDSYQYLIESIRQFPRPEGLKTRLLNAGFSSASYTKLTHGVVCIHKATA